MYSKIEDESQGENLVWQFVDHESIFETGAPRRAAAPNFFVLFPFLLMKVKVKVMTFQTFFEGLQW